MLRETAEAWRRWITNFRYEGPHEALVRRAAITLKLCDHWVNGSLVAAPTSSLPAPVGGVRNWDYRFTWIRDAAFTVFALRRIGFGNEADSFLGWVLDAFEQSRVPRIMYDLDGSPVPEEREDPELEGYRGSAPVRWGNGAADQRQHDVYGAAMCQVALDGAAALGERLGLSEPVPAWRTAADELRQTILEHSWDEEGQTLSEHLDGGGSLDASLLALPLRRVLPADHPRMV